MLAAACALLAVLPAVDRPRDVWAFRSVLDERARMLTLALHEDLWVAYDATHCGLYRAWTGGVNFDGAVYNTVHGPQPTSTGEVHLAGIVDEPLWSARAEGLPADLEPRFRGYTLENGRPVLHFEFVAPTRTVSVREAPEVRALEDGRVELERVFTTEGLRSGETLELKTLTPNAALGDTFETTGDFRPGPEQRIADGTFGSGTLVLGPGTTTVRTTLRVRPPSGRIEQLIAGEQAPPDDPGPREPGLAMRLYQIGVDMSRIPTLMPMQTPNVSRVVPIINFANQAEFGSSVADGFFVQITGYLNISQPGEYMFRLTSDDGSRLLLDEEMVIDHDGLHGAQPKEGTVTLAAGEVPLLVEYFESGVDEVLRLEWRTPDSSSFTIVPAEVFTTPAGEVRVTSPGDKQIVDPGRRNRPGDGMPLTAVYPAYDLATVRPEGFAPRVGGMDFLPDGRLVICTWDPDGGVYVLDGVRDADPSQVKVTRIAAGLAEPLGLKVVDGDIYVLQKQELTRLDDLDGDGLIDRYYAVANGWGVTANFHEFAFGLEYRDEHFYATLATAIDPGGRSTQPQNPDRGTVVRIAKDGDFEFIARGLRTPNGIGFGSFGELYITDNQGDWLPSSKVVVLREGAFYGNRSVRPVRDRSTPEFPPVVWLPQGEIGNSPSQPAPLPHGPYAGQMVHGDVTHGGLKRTFVEVVDGVYQGAVFRFTQGLEAGINRVILGPGGDLYLGGIGSTGNWGQEGKERFGLQRLRFNGQVPFEPLEVRAKANGFEVVLTQPLAEGMGTSPADYRISQWRYAPTAEYGGPKVDEETLRVASVSISDDRRTLGLEIPGLKEGHVVHLRLGRGLQSESGELLWTTEAWYTLNRLPDEALAIAEPEPFTLEEGFEWLFDGTDLSRWKGWREDAPSPSWSIVDGELRVDGTGGDLATREDFGDFELRLEWKVTEGANSGIFWRADEQYWAPWDTGPEMQILDDERHGDGLNPLTSAGSDYAVHAPAVDVVRPAGAWNEVRIRVVGSEVEYSLNGARIVSYTIGSEDWLARVAASKFAGSATYGRALSGKIVLQDHGQQVSFRRIRVQRL